MTTLALIGSGKWGKNYINTIRNLSSCELPDSFIKTKDYKDLFSFNNIDGVIIATPASTHFEIAKEFLEKGFNILVEKPLTTSYEEARDLNEIAEKVGVVAMVGHIYLYNPAFLELENQFKRIGEIKSITSEGMDNGPIRSDVSALWDWGPHDISMIVALLGNPISVCALETGPNLGDSYTLKLNFSGNLSSSSKISRTSSIKKRNITIVGKKGEIFFDDLAGSKLLVKFFAEEKTYCPKIPKITPLENELLEFIDCIKTKRRSKTNLDEALIVQKALGACEKSIKLDGKNIKLSN